jgi:DNA-binding response OmpR family regulator
MRKDDAMNQPPEPRARVLCAVGDEAERNALIAALAEHDVTCAASGYEAMRCLNAGLFDLHVVDQWLPDWDGIQFCRHVRRTDRHVPIVYLSAAGREQDRRRAISAGAGAYLVKPIDPHVLRSQVKELLMKAMLDNLKAVTEEERIVQDELMKRAAEIRAIAANARTSARNAIERATRIKAQKAFVAAGGTIGHFDRAWQPIYASASGKHLDDA